MLAVPLLSCTTWSVEDGDGYGTLGGALWTCEGCGRSPLPSEQPACSWRWTLERVAWRHALWALRCPACLALEEEGELDE